MLILVLALGLNILFARLWAEPYALPDLRIMILVLWTASNVVMLTVALGSTWRALSPVDRHMASYLRKNPGSPFVLTFILSLVFAAATYPDIHVFPPYQRYPQIPTLANDIVTKAFLLLIVGVVLQAIAVAREGSSKDC